MKWATWLLGMVGPIAFRLLTMLGISIVTFTGVTEAFDQLLGLAQSNWSSMPTSVLQLASLWGWPEFLGMVFGAAFARISLWMAAAATRFAFNK